jgi:peptidylprolyl isomerase
MRTVLALGLCLALAGAASAQDKGKAGRGMIPVEPEDLLVIDTSKGRVLVHLRSDVAPATVARVKLLTRKGYYDDNVFYRVFPNYLAQTGQKQVGGESRSGEGTVKDEFSFTPAAAPFPIGERGAWAGSMPVFAGPGGRWYPRFCAGMAALAHYDDPDSGDSQIFFTTGNASGLEKTFTAWGRVLEGLPALQALATGEPPAAPDRMLKVRVAADLPEAERPRVLWGPPGSKAFEAALAKAKKAKGEFVAACDVELPVEVAG